MHVILTCDRFSIPSDMDHISSSFLSFGMDGIDTFIMGESYRECHPSIADLNIYVTFSCFTYINCYKMEW